MTQLRKRVLEELERPFTRMPRRWPRHSDAGSISNITVSLGLGQPPAPLPQGHGPFRPILDILLHVVSRVVRLISRAVCSRSSLLSKLTYDVLARRL